MQTFKRITISVVAFLIAIIAFSVVIIEPMIQNENAYYCDAKSRTITAGEYNYIFIGDSDGMTAFSPQVFDKETNYTSYNLSGTMMTAGSEYFLLQKEIERNPVDTVVLQVSYEFFARDPEKERGDGDSVTVQRLDTILERLLFMMKHVKIDDWLNIYSRLLVSGISDWKTRLTGGVNEKCDYYLKGWHKVASTDLTIAKPDIHIQHNSQKISLDFVYDHRNEVTDIIELCREKDVKLYFVVLPVSNEHIWKYEGWDSFREWFNQYCEQEDVQVFDMNLYKDKYKYLSDDVSYKDYAHLSEEGAEQFTTMFAKFWNSFESNDNTEIMFYNSYVEMEKDSPYAHRED